MSLNSVGAVSRAGWLLAAFASAGCLVGPDYSTPAIELPDAWLDIKAPTAADRAEDARWWTRFDDPVLNELVAEALAENLSLRQAGLRVIQARAQRGISV